MRVVDPSQPRGRVYRAMARMAGSRPGLWLARTVSWRLDPILLRLTGGRVASSGPLATALLETRGARSGAPRRAAVLYFHDGERVTIVASRAGDTRHPAWFHNAVAHPDVRLGGRPYRAAVVTDDAERERLWHLADAVFPPFADYRRTAGAAGRTIPILQLTATGDDRR